MICKALYAFVKTEQFLIVHISWMFIVWALTQNIKLLEIVTEAHLVRRKALFIRVADFMR